MPRAMRPSTRLSVAALVSPHARMGPVRSARLGAAAPAVASTCSSASSVRVLPVPGGPCAASVSHKFVFQCLVVLHILISGIRACDTEKEAVRQTGANSSTKQTPIGMTLTPTWFRKAEKSSETPLRSSLGACSAPATA